MNILRRRNVAASGKPSSSSRAQDEIEEVGSSSAAPPKDPAEQELAPHEPPSDGHLEEQEKKKKETASHESSLPSSSTQSDEGGEVINPSNAVPISSSASSAKIPKGSSASAAKPSFPNAKKGSKRSAWGCLDTCCWLVGYICCLWWMLLVLYKALPSLSEAITGPLPDPPGVKLKKEGLQALHPIVFVPGIVTGGLELWEGRPCADGLFRKRLWGGTFGEVYKRYTSNMDELLTFCG